MPIDQTQPSVATDPSRPPWLPPWQGADYADNTQHHRRFDDWFLAGTPAATDRPRARHRLRVGRLHGRRRRPRCPMGTSSASMPSPR